MEDKPKLLDQVREKLRVKHYSIRTEQAYVDWIKRFALFHRKCHPETMGNRGGFRVYQPSGDTPECGGVHSER